MAAGTAQAAVWTPEEQAALERCLTAMDPSVSTLRRAALVAAELPAKSLRDVVQRISALQDCMPEATAAAAAVSSATAFQAGLSSSGVVYDALGNPDIQVGLGWSCWRAPRFEPADRKTHFDTPSTMHYTHL